MCCTTRVMRRRLRPHRNLTTRTLPHEIASTGRAARADGSGGPGLSCVTTRTEDYLTWEQFLRINIAPGLHVTRSGSSAVSGRGLPPCCKVWCCASVSQQVHEQRGRLATAPAHPVTSATNSPTSNRAGRLRHLVRGDGVDAAVAWLFLSFAIQPAQLEVSPATLTQIEDQAPGRATAMAVAVERASLRSGSAPPEASAVDPEEPPR